MHLLRHPRVLLGGDLYKRLFELSQNYQEIPARRPGRQGIIAGLNYPINPLSTSIYLHRHPRTILLHHPRMHLLRHPRVHPLRHPRMLLGGDLHKRLFRLSQSYQEIPAQRPG